MSYSVCIVTPGNLASNPRVIKEANALHSAGYQVIVVTNGAISGLRELDKDLGLVGVWDVRRTKASLLDRIRCRFWMALSRRCLSLGMAVPLSMAVRAFSAQTPALMRCASQIRADLYIAH